MTGRGQTGGVRVGQVFGAVASQISHDVSGGLGAALAISLGPTTESPRLGEHIASGVAVRTKRWFSYPPPRRGNTASPRPFTARKTTTVHVAVFLAAGTLLGTELLFNGWALVMLGLALRSPLKALPPA